MTKFSRKSFTLIELLLVVSMLSMVSLALFNTMANGLKIWDRSRKFVVEEDAAIFFDKIGYDLRNCFAYSKIPFVGKENRIRFATRVRNTREDVNQWIEKMGAVEYYFDFASKKLYRRQASYGQAINGNFTEERDLLKAIDSVKFSYYYAQENQLAVNNQITESMIPEAIGIEIEFWEGGFKHSLRKLVNLPQGG